MSEYKRDLPTLIDMGERIQDELASWLGNRGYEVPIALRRAVFIMNDAIRIGLPRLRNLK